MLHFMYEEGDWAIILQPQKKPKNDVYYVRHNTCGAYLKAQATRGCICKAVNAPIGERKPIPVATNILKMYLLLTGIR